MTSSQNISDKTSIPRKPLTPPKPSDVLEDKDNISDYTSGKVDGRYLWINFGFIKYGTDDRTQGAAMVLCILLLILISLTVVGCLAFDKVKAMGNILQILIPAFTLVAGVAIGNSIGRGDQS